LISGRNEYLSSLKQGGSLSIEKPSDLKDIHDRLYTGRVDDRYGLPVALYHKELATLQHRLESLDSQAKNARILGDDVPQGIFTELDASLIDNAAQYFKISRAFYSSEKDRWRSAEFFFNQIFGSDDLWTEGNSDAVLPLKKGTSRSRGTTTKGENRADVGWGSRVVLEVKNESGLRGDASLQGLHWYAKHCDRLKACTRVSPLGFEC
jgi:hypothetical protein